jgi:hypothetical protein
MNKCIACSTDFEGRSNQKYCSLTCKNSYHNLNNKEKEAHIIELNKILHKNWVILHKLYEIHRSSPIGLQILRANGFIDKYHTHLHISPRGESYTMIYDFGFKYHIDDQVQIVQGDL